MEEEKKEDKKYAIAFPLLGTGVYGFPRKIAFQIAISEIVSFLLDHKGVSVYLVVFDKESVELAKQVWPDVKESIDDIMAKEKSDKEYVKEASNTTLIRPKNMEEVKDNFDPKEKEYYDKINAVSMGISKTKTNPEARL